MIRWVRTVGNVLLIDQRLREVDDIDIWNGFRPLPDNTVIPQPKIGVAPLQPPINNPEEDAVDGAYDVEFPTFGFIEEVANFFSKHS
jgi:hypothetical protein